MKIGNVVFDCSDPDRVATFWAAVLGYEKGEYPPEMRKELLEAGLTEAELAGRSIAEDPAGDGPRLFFQRVPEAKSVKNRVHLDITVADLKGEIDRLCGLGASILTSGEGHAVMQDPEGNEFCLTTRA